MVVFGATGPTGLEIVKQSLAAGHQVTAIARSPSKMEIEHQDLTVHQGDVLDLASFSSALKGQDIVISALGAKPSRKPISLYSHGIDNILQAMQENQLKRLICVTAAALLSGDPNLPFFFKHIIKPLFFQRVYDDMIRMEKRVQESAVEYTFVRPPRLLDGPVTGQYRAEEAYSLKKGGTINRADVAHYIIDHLQDQGIVRKGIAIAY